MDRGGRTAPLQHTRPEQHTSAGGDWREGEEKGREKEGEREREEHVKNALNT